MTTRAHKALACFLAMTAIALSPSAPARSADPHDASATVREAEPDDAVFRVTPGPANTLYVQGFLEAGSFIKFRRVLGAHPRTRTVYLASPGGLVLEGYLIGTTVRERGLATYVEYLCASACTLILASGKDRAAAPDAVIGFHQSHTVAPDGSIHAQSVAAAPAHSATDLNPDVLQRSAFERAGVSAAFIAQALATPFDTMWYPTPAEMEAAGVFTRRSAGNEVALLPGLGRSRDEITALMLGSTLWARVRQRDETLFALAGQRAFRLSQAGASDTIALFEAHELLGEALLPKIATAPEKTVDAFLTAALSAISRSRNAGGPRCLRDVTAPRGGDAEVREIMEAEAPLFLDLLSASANPVPRMSRSRARSILRPIIRQEGHTSGSPAHMGCEQRERIIERIAALPPAKRIRAFRALSILGTSANREFSPG
jgi:hypothetical protein